MNLRTRRTTGGRALVTRFTNSGLALAVVAMALVAVVSPGSVTTDQTTPAAAGVPAAPIVVFSEDFENNPAPAAQNYSTYIGATPAGETYTGSPKWINGARCNGVILSYANTTTPTWAQSGTSAADSGTNGRCSDAPGVRSYQFLRMLALAMGRQFTPGSPTTDHVTSGYTECQTTSTTGDTCDVLPSGPTNGIMFKTVTPIPTTVGHYFTFGVNTAYINCGLASADPSYQFATVSATGTVTPIGNPLNGCVNAPAGDPNVKTYTQTVTHTVGGIFGGGTGVVTKDVRINSMLTSQAFQATTTSTGIQMWNNNGATNGNDGAFDDVRLVDVTPTVDKSFSPALIGPGGKSTLTITVTNTSDSEVYGEKSVEVQLAPGADREITVADIDKGHSKKGRCTPFVTVDEG